MNPEPAVPTGTGEHEPEETYAGPAVVVHDGGEVPVTVVLRGLFQPLDGRFHWYGRVDDAGALAAAGIRSGAEVALRTPHGEAPARLNDPDPWGRFRVGALGAPPF